jgi:hypothetical protein
MERGTIMNPVAIIIDSISDISLFAPLGLITAFVYLASDHIQLRGGEYGKDN